MSALSLTSALLFSQNFDNIREEFRSIINLILLETSFHAGVL